MRKLIVLIVSLSLLLVSASYANAAQSAPFGKYGNSFTLEILSYNDVDSDSTLSWGDYYTLYATASSISTAYGSIGVSCYQNWVSSRNKGTHVYSANWWLRPYPVSVTYRLSSQTWTGGSAHCYASSYIVDGSKVYILTTIEFDVAV